jgi:phosphohistidine swiveling domain-containing protein
MPSSSLLVPVDGRFEARDLVSRVGQRAAGLVKLAARGVAIAPTWVILPSVFDGILRDHFSNAFELRALLKLAGTSEGDERVARLHEELVSATLPAPLAEALEASLAPGFPACDDELLVVRPSLVARGDGADDGGSMTVAWASPGRGFDLPAAILRAYAGAVSSLELDCRAEAGARDFGVALLVQRARSRDPLAWVARDFEPQRRGEGRAWKLGIPIGEGVQETGRPLMFAAFDSVARGESSSLSARALAPLGPAAGEFAAQVAGVLETEVGPDACAALGLAADGTLAVLFTEPRPRWRALRAEGEDAWVELGRSPGSTRPIRALGRSLLLHAAEASAVAGLRSLGAAHDEPRRFVRSARGRVYLGLDSVAASIRDLPEICWEDVYRAVGTGSHDFIDERRVASAPPKRRVRSVLRFGTLAARQATQERELVELERELGREAAALADLDLVLLPTDGLGTTLLRAEDLVVRAAEFGARLAATQLAYLVAVRAVLRRASPEVDLGTASLVASAQSGSLGSSMLSALARVVDVVRNDRRAREAIRDGAAGHGALPDGPARGAIGQFLSTYGDLAVAPFDLAIPTWSEDSRDVLRVVRSWLDREGAARVAVETAEERVRARADAELARHEPDLGWTERTVLRTVLARIRELARAQGVAEALLYRTLALFRRVVADADRRIRRVDPRARERSAEALSIDRLVAAFRTGRPEIGHLVQLADFEAELLALAPVPPLVFRGAPPRMPSPIVTSDALSGIGISAGVVDGSVSPSDGVIASGIIVTAALETAELPRYFLAGAVVAEEGGLLSPAASALRALGIPAVASVEAATRLVSPGERVRVDGMRGAVVRFGEARIP